ncbi:MAG: hypothetical protein BMS9Abin24_151 [Thermodesulfobacteriota bacterium]|nr:MAG: hypothetical protein BMS9Abin24_151 [Thermodesulfobacteriota bacterium]
MKETVVEIKGVMGLSGRTVTHATLKKLLLLICVSALAALLYFPSLTFIGYSYRPGDVAYSDIKSPESVSAPGVEIKKGETIVRDGQIIGEDDILKIELVEAAIKQRRSVVPVMGFFAFTLVFIGAFYWFLSRNVRKFASAPKDLLLMACIFAGILFMLRLTESASFVMKEVFPGPISLYRYIIPIAVGPMLVRLLLNSETALAFAVLTSVMAGFFMGGDLAITVYSLIGGVVAAMGVRHCTHRSIVLKAGLLLGAANGATLLSMAALKGGASFSDPAFILLGGFLNGITASILAVGLAPVLEWAFKYTTDIKLLELSRMDHPLLKELAMRAPGTYHHSIVIGTLAEAGAESINANPLLARVASYYHDIGKLKMPDYFIENAGENKHDRLTPSMSSLVLTSHVKEGAEMAEKHGLGPAIIDIIRQHHGTSLITFFYQKAVSVRGVDGKEVDEKGFRYAGPRPQTKEAGLVMLADAIEAASRTLPDPTPDRLQWLAQKIVNRIFTDGQLDECELTLKDLHSITKSFNRVFAGIYHQRIEYPEPAQLLTEDGVEGSGESRGGGRGPAGGGKDKKDGRDRLKRLGMR